MGSAPWPSPRENPEHCIDGRPVLAASALVRLAEEVGRENSVWLAQVRRQGLVWLKKCRNGGSFQGGPTQAFGAIGSRDVIGRVCCVVSPLPGAVPERFI